VRVQNKKEVAAASREPAPAGATFLAVGVSQRPKSFASRTWCRKGEAMGTILLIIFILLLLGRSLLGRSSVPGAALVVAKFLRNGSQPAAWQAIT
jgi:hypothetical protein